MGSSCANRECGQPLALLGRSGHDPRLCSGCGELVWAFRPNRERPDDWFHAGDRPEDGLVVDGDQCEGCGLSAYTLRRASAHGWVAVCEGQEWDQTTIAGCGARHPVRMRPAMSVVF